MDFLSFDIVVSDNIVSDYPVLRGEIFAKLSCQPTLKLARWYLSLLQTGPRSYFLKLVSSCYFFPRTDDGRICWKFQIPPGKGKTIAMFVLFKFQTYSIVCLTKFPRNIYIHKRAEPPESEKPNGPSIEEGKRDSAKSKFNEVTSWSCSFGSARKRWKRGNVGVRPSWCGANQSQRGRRVVSAFENYGTTFISISTEMVSGKV